MRLASVWIFLCLTLSLVASNAHATHANWRCTQALTAKISEGLKEAFEGDGRAVETVHVLVLGTSDGPEVKEIIRQFTRPELQISLVGKQYLKSAGATFVTVRGRVAELREVFTHMTEFLHFRWAGLTRSETIARRHTPARRYEEVRRVAKRYFDQHGPGFVYSVTPYDNSLFVITVHAETREIANRLPKEFEGIPVNIFVLGEATPVVLSVTPANNDVKVIPKKHPRGDSRGVVIQMRVLENNTLYFDHDKLDPRMDELLESRDHSSMVYSALVVLEQDVPVSSISDVLGESGVIVDKLRSEEHMAEVRGTIWHLKRTAAIKKVTNVTLIPTEEAHWDLGDLEPLKTYDPVTRTGIYGDVMSQLTQDPRKTISVTVHFKSPNAPEGIAVLEMERLAQLGVKITPNKYAQVVTLEGPAIMLQPLLTLEMVRTAHLAFDYRADAEDAASTQNEATNLAWPVFDANKVDTRLAEVLKNAYDSSDEIAEFTVMWKDKVSDRFQVAVLDYFGAAKMTHNNDVETLLLIPGGNQWYLGGTNLPRDLRDLKEKVSGLILDILRMPTEKIEVMAHFRFSGHHSENLVEAVAAAKRYGAEVEHLFDISSTAFFNLKGPGVALLDLLTLSELEVVHYPAGRSLAINPLKLDSRLASAYLGRNRELSEMEQPEVSIFVTLDRRLSRDALKIAFDNLRRADLTVSGERGSFDLRARGNFSAIGRASRLSAVKMMSLAQ